jgi:hypothetical protein
MINTYGASSRFFRAVDALSLAKLLVGVLMFVLWDGSPLYALGVVFGAPVCFAALVRICRELRFALTGSKYGVRGDPPERLGIPSSRRR